jgi:membrane-bound lytic murein transglycosylase B
MKRRQSNIKRKTAIVFVLVVSMFLTSASTWAAEGFVEWLHDFYSEAESNGITKQTWDIAFSGITEPDQLVLERASYQPEFVQEVWQYLDTRVNQLSTKRGLEMAELHMPTLALLENQFGVSKSILLAIWSMETNYGAVLTRRDRLHYVPQALATLAWGDEKRSKFARNQLIATLQILQSGDITRNDLLGSWAGAMGHTQFIPTSYLAYAVDMDGNGRRDIWNSVPDALATAANLLSKNGWQSDKTWGYEVQLPHGAGAYAEETRTISEWEKMGVVRVGGRQFPRPDDKAILKVLAGENGPCFLMLKNFFVIKRYNNSDKYALAVGLLADRIAGTEGLVKAWPRPKDSLSADENIELQRLLKLRGYYNGEIDGYLGTESKAAIREFEKHTGRQVNGMPTRAVLEGLQK